MSEVIWGAVVVAGGVGSRFGAGIPKQFVDIGGRKMIDWSLDTFRKTGKIRELAVVLPRDESLWREFWSPAGDILLTGGGDRRQDSVLEGLKLLRSSTHVLVHDAARPWVSAELVNRVMRAAEEHGSAVPLIPVRDTVKRVDESGRVLETIPRVNLRLSQTPQAFELDELRKVLEASGDVTDECSAMEKAGFRVAAVEGDPMNVKVTDPNDLDSTVHSAGGIMKSRTGIGIDFHPFTNERPMVLGGCRIEGCSGLQGHSDGDAVLHAVADALLSAVRKGDIGVLFPPGDAEWKDMDSSLILERAAELVREGGWEIHQLDITVMSTEPRISGNRDRIISRISQILRVPEDLVWIKGTTMNSLGAVGRGEGLGCLAAVTIVGRRGMAGRG